MQITGIDDDIACKSLMMVSFPIHPAYGNDVNVVALKHQYSLQL